MPVRVELGANRVAYKCFNCLRMKNPVSDPLHVITVIVGVAGNKQGPGMVTLNLANQHVCGKCFRKLNSRKAFCDIADVNMQGPQQGGAIAQSPPVVVAQPGAELPPAPQSQPNQP